jgi:hypothetical protein
MRRHLPARFWFETMAAAVGFALLLLTLVSNEWFEELTGYEPDGGNGAFEIVLPLALLAIAASSSIAARRVYRRTPLTA